MKRIGLVLLGACLILGACSDTKKIAPKEGRIAVISEEKMIKSSEKIKLDKDGYVTVNWHNKSDVEEVPFWKVKSEVSIKNRNDKPFL